MAVVKTHGTWPEAPWKPLAPRVAFAYTQGMECALACPWQSAHFYSGGFSEKQRPGFSQTLLWKGEGGFPKKAPGLVGVN